MIQQLLFRRTLMMLLGIGMMGVGVSAFRFADLGTDPFSCMNIGISNALGISFGTGQLIVNILIFIILIIANKSHFGTGTLINMIFVGYVSDFFLSILGHWSFLTESFVGRLAIVFIALIITALAASLYMSAAMGVAPYDAVAMEAEHKWKIPFRIGRITTDLLCVIIGFLLGSTVNIGTIATVILMGPLVAYFRSSFTNRLVNKASLKTITIKTT